MPILNRSNVLTAMLRTAAEKAAILSRYAPFAFHPVPAMPLILFQRDDCHLCDLALDVLANARIPDFESVFIDDDDTLEARYGIRVPVLHRSDTGAELDWPFDASALDAFLQR